MKARDQVALAFFNAAMQTLDRSGNADLVMYLWGAPYAPEETVNEFGKEQRASWDAKCADYISLEEPAKEQTRALWERCLALADVLKIED